MEPDVPAATCNLRRLSIRHASSMATGTYSFDSQGEYQRPKPSVLESFYHRRQPSQNVEALPTFPLEINAHFPKPEDTMVGQYIKNNPGALGELQGNQQEAAPRLARPINDGCQNDSRGRSRSPTKNPISNISLKVTVGKDSSKLAKSREASPTKSKKNLAGLLRPKSLRNLSKLVSDEDIRLSKDKENRTPDEPLSAPAPPPPIFAQFTSDPSFRQKPDGRSSIDVTRNVTQPELYNSVRPAVKERPKSFQVPPKPRPDMPSSPTKSRYAQNGSRKLSNEEKSPVKSSRNKVFSAFTTFGHGRSKSTSASPSPEPAEQVLDPKDIDKHLEAMLDRRNIPENQRYKMRNLNETIKLELIRQDWAEMHSSKSDRPGTTDSRRSDDNGSAVGQGSDNEDKPKRSRGKSFTLSRGKKEPSSPVKKSKGDGTLGRHFRSKSTENISGDIVASSAGASSSNGILSKIKLQPGPAEYVAYLRKVQKPELVEVGKIHKLRILLRNETVAWIEEFIQQGGMKEIVGLLNRIIEVEWRFVIQIPSINASC